MGYDGGSVDESIDSRLRKYLIVGVNVIRAALSCGEWIDGISVVITAGNGSEVFIC